MGQQTPINIPCSALLQMPTNEFHISNSNMIDTFEAARWNYIKIITNKTFLNYCYKKVKKKTKWKSVAFPFLSALFVCLPFSDPYVCEKKKKTLLSSYSLIITGALRAHDMTWLCSHLAAHRIERSMPLEGRSSQRPGPAYRIDLRSTAFIKSSDPSILFRDTRAPLTAYLMLFNIFLILFLSLWHSCYNIRIHDCFADGFRRWYTIYIRNE